MSDHLLTSKDQLTEHRRCLNVIRNTIRYDIVNSPHGTEFEELEVLLDDSVHKIDKLHDLLKKHVYAYDVTITATMRVYVKGEYECDAEDAAQDYAEDCIHLDGEWSMQDTVVFRDEDEETTSVYDVEV